MRADGSPVTGPVPVVMIESQHAKHSVQYAAKGFPTLPKTRSVKCKEICFATAIQRIKQVGLG
eukprot:4076360-Amphidinium_carterae.1